MYTILFAALLYFDLYMKHLARKKLNRRNIPINTFLTLRLMENEGALLGVLKNKTILFYGSTGAITALLLRALIMSKEDFWYSFFCILLLAGAWGNFIERVEKKSVTDFIGIRFYKKVVIFNIADFYILIAAIALMILEL